MPLPNFPIIRRKPYKDKWDKTHWKIILEYLSNMKSDKELEKFFVTFLPKKDRLNLIQRIVAYKRLQEGYKYREIEAEIGISRQSISAIKQATEEDLYRAYNDRSAKVREKKREKILNYLDRKAEKPVPKRYRRTKYGKISF